MHETQPTPPTKAPVPEKRPAEAPAETERSEPPQTAPKPPKKPADAEEPPKPPEIAPEPEENPAEPQRKPSPALDPRSAAVPAQTMPAEEIACRDRLKALGVEFEDRKAERDAEIGCSIPYPIMVKKLGKSIDITPEAELNCQMTEAIARFAGDIVSPAAKAELGSELKSLSQASAYVCRPRHNGAKMSEHAFGNALDIASFTLADGTRIDIGPAPPEKQAKFLNIVRKAACGPFKTVLGPGSDPDHSVHFHLDLEPRRNGGTFCQ